MSKLQTFLDEVMEARKHDCSRCGHPNSKHAFDIYPITNPNKPCEMSCTICFDEETERLKQEGKLQ